MESRPKYRYVRGIGTNITIAVPPEGGRIEIISHFRLPDYVDYRTDGVVSGAISITDFDDLIAILREAKAKAE